MSYNAGATIYYEVRASVLEVIVLGSVWEVIVACFRKNTIPVYTRKRKRGVWATRNNHVIYLRRDSLFRGLAKAA